MFKKSDEIDLIAKAFVKCQGELEAAPKSADNPFFHSKYADLGSVVRATRPILAAHGLAVTQTSVPTGIENYLEIETTLIHESGQYWGSLLTMPLDKPTPQGFGSAMTYGRRYAYSAILGVITEEDDDAEGATTRNGDSRPVQSRPTGNPDCPNCLSSEAVIKGKEEYGGGWVCWAKKGGCGINFQDGTEPTKPTAKAKTPPAKNKAATGGKGFHTQYSDNGVPLTPKGVEVTALSDSDLMGYLTWLSEQGDQANLEAIFMFCNEYESDAWPCKAAARQLVTLQKGAK